MPPRQRAETPVAAVPDFYTPTEAARVLGISEKRIRQLADAGKLDKAGMSPLRLTQVSVIAERDRRKREGVVSGGRPARKPLAGTDEESLARMVGVIADKLIPRALESATQQATRTEAYLRDELARERALRETAEARVRELEAEKAATRPRRWRRSP